MRSTEKFRGKGNGPGKSGDPPPGTSEHRGTIYLSFTLWVSIVFDNGHKQRILD